jgi:hypothetical protein
LKQRGAPEKTVAVFKRHYLTIAARNLTGQAAIARLEKDLQKRQITIMVLKGASLSDLIYSRPGLRMMEDVDILVRPADRSRFIAMLNRHGFQADPGRSHCFIKGQTVVDLHTDALNVERVASRKWLFPSGMQPIWDRSLPWKEDCRQIRRPADIDNVLLLSQHALKHACARLIWLVDLWLLLRGRPLQFWEALHERAVQLHQLKALYQILFLLASEFELVVPGPFEKPAGQIFWLNRQLLLLREDGRTDAYTGILLPLFSISGFKKRVVFALESVFLSRTTAQKEFASSFTSRPAVYYLNRLGFSAVQALNFIHRLGISLLTQREL